MNHEPDDEEDLLDTWEAADRIGVTVERLRYLRRLGRGPTYLRAGRRIFYRRLYVDAWLTRREGSRYPGPRH